MNTCKKCGHKFKTRQLIDGDLKNFNKRKFCLVCSPFKNHNTKPDDPLRESVVSRKNNKFVKDERYYKFQRKMSRRKWLRAKEKKKRLVALKGGKCIHCGYNKCMRSLAFHHRDSSQKSFPLSVSSIAGRSWEKLIIEAEKCDLLCMNCHMELHDSC